jgi:hypothetical protein
MHEALGSIPTITKKKEKTSNNNKVKIIHIQLSRAERWFPFVVLRHH